MHAEHNHTAKPTVYSRCLQLLGLRGREKYLEREVTAAYDTLAGTPLEEGYSPRVAAGRLAVLGQAVQHLRGTKGQAPLMGAGLEVEWDHLNGALALMQEVGGSCRWRPLQVEAFVLAVQEWCIGCALEAVPRCRHGSRWGPRVQCLHCLQCSSSVQKVGWEGSTGYDVRQRGSCSSGPLRTV